MNLLDDILDFFLYDDEIFDDDIYSSLEADIEKLAAISDMEK